MNTVLFAVFPYVAIVLAILFGIYRYVRYRFSFSSLSTQFLEKRQLFWGSVPWHYGIILILLAHIIAGIAPGFWAVVLGGPIRRFVLESVGMGLALFTLFGLAVLIVRRAFNGASTASTSAMDWFILGLFAAQVIAGLGIAYFRRWGGLWYLSNAVPWLESIFSFAPDVSRILPLPLLVKFHIVIAFVLILLYPFSRLVHIGTVPIPYLWRPYQVVVWNRAPRAVPRGSMRQGPADNDPPDDPPDDPPRRGFPGHPFEIQPSETTRRKVLEKVSISLGSLAAAVIVVPSIAFLLGLRKAPNVWRSVGHAADFKPGTTTEVSFVDPSPLPWSGVTAKSAAWLRHERTGEFIAYSVDCTHLGCPIRWLPDPELFMCPCHGGVFYKDGRVASGPPPRPLVRYPLRVRNGNVEILTSPLPIAG